ncbi:MAG TPA: lipopolysaccharide biosynthesis protein, partial [Bryobacteraceae bacterium]|nr:lipopolysaccharide biosynthesis protein [Bryobacteraceae bacterium]
MAIVASGTSVGQCIQIVAMPLVAKLYGPTEFGVLAVIVAVVGIIQVIAALRYDAAVLIAPSDEVERDLLIVCLCCIAAVTALTGIGAWAYMTYPIFGLQVPAHSLLYIPLCVGAIGLYNTFHSAAVRRQDLVAIARTRMWQGGSTVGLQLAGAALAHPSAGLLIAYLGGQCTGVLSLARKVFSGPAPAISWSRIRATALQFSDYPTISAGSGLLNIASLHVPGLALASFFGLEVAAWFSLGQRILMLPLTFVGLAVAQVYNGRAAIMAREDTAALKTLFVKTSRGLFITGCLTIIPVACLAPYAVNIAMGPAWAEAAVYIVVLSPALIAQFVVSPVSGTLAIKRRLGRQAALDAVRHVA